MKIIEKDITIKFISRYMVDMFNVNFGVIDDNNMYMERNGKRAYVKFKNEFPEYEISSDDKELEKILDNFILFASDMMLYVYASKLQSKIDMLNMFGKISIAVSAVLFVIIALITKSDYLAYVFIPLFVFENIFESILLRRYTNEAEQIFIMGKEINRKRMEQKNA